jgi:hypothetical protein
VWSNGTLEAASVQATDESGILRKDSSQFGLLDEPTTLILDASYEYCGRRNCEEDRRMNWWCIGW